MTTPKSHRARFKPSWMRKASESYVVSEKWETLRDENRSLGQQVAELQQERRELRQRLEQAKGIQKLAYLFLDPPRAVIRDAVHHSIPLSEREQALINTPEFLRLARIRQLGFIWLIWPGANHTRFDHSLGAFHLARQALIQLFQKGDQGGLEPLDSEDVRTFLAAVLLHDIGHYPYSHAIEALGLPIRSHEQVGSEIIRGARISEILAEEWGVEASRVADLVGKDRSKLEGIDRLFKQLLDGPLDVDKLDYLVRDATHCNVPYGQVDVHRLIESLWVKRENGNMSLAITHKGVGPLHSLIWAKEGMFRNVYWHHTNRIATMMFLRAVQDALEANKITPQQLTGMHDWSVIDLLKNRTDEESSTWRLIDRIENRRLYKRAVKIAYNEQTVSLYNTVGSLQQFQSQRKKVEAALCQSMAKRLGTELPDHAILIDVPRQESFEINIEVYHASPPQGVPEYAQWRDAAGLTTEELERKQLRTRLIRLIARDDELAEQIAKEPNRAHVMEILSHCGSL